MAARNKPRRWRRELPDKEYEGVAEHAARMGVSVGTIRDWLAKDLIAGVIQVKPGATYRIPIPEPADSTDVETSVAS